MANNQVQNQAQNQGQAYMAPFGIPRSAGASAASAKKSQSETNAATYHSAAPSPPAPAAADEVPAFGASSSRVQVSGPASSYLIAVPGTSLLWRAGRRGVIDFSSDHGVSWSPQVSGAHSDLTAGSAPSAKICWIVGRAGTIVLTADAGAHWSTLHSPTEEDLGGVRASDALRATIWNSRNTKFFETTDGGASWKSVPAP